MHVGQYALVVAGCAAFLLALIASQTWEPSQAPNVLIQQQLQRQRGAAVGARGGKFEPRVGQRLANVEVDTFGQQAAGQQHAIGQNEPLVTAKTMREALASLKGKPIESGATLKIADGQQLRYTGRYGDTSYVVNAPQGDPATVYAHNSIWPSLIHRNFPYVEAVHGDGTPYMKPLTVYAPPGGTVVTSVMPGTSARPPIPTRYAMLPEANNAPLDNTVYRCAPSGYMVGPVGYHCTPACKDSALWRSDYGGCDIYRDTPVTSGGFKDYCGSDTDIAAVPASVACPVACGTCGIGMCYESGGFKKCKLSTYSTDTLETV